MSSINKVIIIGRLGRDPEVRYTTSGSAICNVTVATDRRWKDKTSGELQEEVEWHRVVLFDRLADVAGEYLKKGRQVYIEGRLKTRKWTDKDGVEKYTTEIMATEMSLLGSKDDGEAGGQAPQRQESATAARRPPPLRAPPSTPANPPSPGRRPPQTKSNTGFDSMDDDIPF